MADSRSRSRTKARRPGHRPAPSRRRRLTLKARLATASIALLLGLLAWAAIARQLASSGNTQLTRFDVLIVLGSPADSDGNPTPKQLARVLEAVNEYKRGVAPRLILTGGAVRNRFIEARIMQRTAEAQGVPESAIFVEPEARDTIQNACFADRIMKEHNWHSAEVISSAVHLPRAGLIFGRLPLEWRTHAAVPLEPQPAFYAVAGSLKETLSTVRYLVWSRPMERCEP